MFSDRHRILKIVLLAIALAGLIFYARTAKVELTLSQCLTDPGLYDGREVPVGLEAKVVEVRPDRLRISQLGGLIDVKVPPGFDSIVPRGTRLEDLQPGQFVQARTVFHRGGYLELRELRVASLRKIKILVSILPVLLVAVWLARSLRWRKGGLTIIEKK